MCVFIHPENIHWTPTKCHAKNCSGGDMLCRKIEQGRKECWLERGCCFYSAREGLADVWTEDWCRRGGWLCRNLGEKAKAESLKVEGPEVGVSWISNNKQVGVAGVHLVSGLGVAGEVRKVTGPGGGREPVVGFKQKLPRPDLCFKRPTSPAL